METQALRPRRFLLDSGALSTATQTELIGPLLKEVSRSFYLTLRVLPEPIRPQISLAYLLARASDTIADTAVVDRRRRLELLKGMQRGEMRAVAELVQHQALPAERILLQRLGDCQAMLAQLNPADQQRIHDLLQTIIGGQIFDLEKFPGETEADLIALSNEKELDQYTYMVAGCVGEFWTRMCAAHLRELECWRDGGMEEAGIRFGKGLQLVNILRDMPKDLRIGRCYLPVRDPKALLEPRNFVTILPQYTQWLDAAVAHLDAGWTYALAIPGNLKRLRLACIWPIWIGLETIAQLRDSNPLDPAKRVKVARGTVYAIMAQSTWLAGNDGALQEIHQKRRARAVQNA